MGNVLLALQIRKLRLIHPFCKGHLVGKCQSWALMWLLYPKAHLLPLVSLQKNRNSGGGETTSSIKAAISWYAAWGSVTFPVTCRDGLYSIPNALLEWSHVHLDWLEEDQIRTVCSWHQLLTWIWTRSCRVIQVEKNTHIHTLTQNTHFC